MAVVPEPEVQFAQRLAANEKPVRTKALKKLRKYINVRSQRAVGELAAPLQLAASPGASG